MKSNENNLLYAEVTPEEESQVDALFQAGLDLFRDIACKNAMAMEFVVGRGLRLIPQPGAKPTPVTRAMLVWFGGRLLKHANIKGNVQLMTEELDRRQAAS